ncbi:replication restart helicase PriA [Candidatus Trichorickettsia mobilis]|uniref:replication restart helicase PriA n=1 Tax=Candidatus Trichorickettsia mobilis TaxID=1346319 RepID=UPI00292F52FA|nr:primosomal protein N' [Candidatus Trichorickettsia mobilis]
MIIVKILLPLTQLFPLEYLAPEALQLIIGDLVIVPFRNKMCTGIVWSTSNIASNNTIVLKTVQQKAPGDFTLNSGTMNFINKASSYYLSPLGSMVKLVLPIDISVSPIKTRHQHIPSHFNLPNLSTNQHEILAKLRMVNKPTLIHGVTGSGKTEIYFHLVAEYLQAGAQTLIMLPEIALSNHIIQRFINRFGFEPVIWNSSITKAQKKMSLRGILDGRVRMVIGARSSLFLPYTNLGLIIVDEEHDSSYKQEEGILYNARDMAVLRGSLENAKVVLVSATPSIETIYNVQIDKYHNIPLANRYSGATIPPVEIVDLRKERLPYNNWLSPSLSTAIQENLLKKEQTLLFLNRRGYAPLMLCSSCGYRFTCGFCSSWLVVHKNSKHLECHHCGYICKIHLTCLICSAGDTLIACGPGIERIAEEVQHLFGNYRIAIVSKDEITNSNKMQALLHKMENNEIDILIGTQMITKGYHFPNLTLVGIIDADLGLMGGDLRAAERTFQLLHQVGGRAGREHKPGKVLLQTYYPDHIVFSTLKNNAEEQFIEYELNNRRDANLPPFTKMASIILTGKNEHKIFDYAKQLVAIAPKSNVKILGPAKAMLAKLSGKYRYRILIVTAKKFNLQQYLKTWLGLVKFPSSCQIRVDIDPQNFM